MLGTIFLALGDEVSSFNPLKLETGNMLWTWIIFLVALPLAWKFVMGPITRAMEERDERVQEAIQRAEKAGKDAERARAEIEVKLGEAQAGAAKMLADARERAEERERELIEDAKRESAALRERALADIETAKDQALSVIRDEVVEISLLAASQVLKRGVGSEDDKRLVRELVASEQAKPGARG